MAGKRKASAFLKGLAILILVLLVFPLSQARPLAQEEEEAHDRLVTGYIDGKAFAFDQAQLESRAAIVQVLDGDQSSDLLHFRHKERVYIASLTKIMTGLTAYKSLIQSGRSLDDKATVRPSDLEGLAELNASMAGFQMGEVVAFRDLFYGLFLSSGCDAANTLARETAGSQANFVEKMNEEAAELGLRGTHFANTSGLFHVDNYGTLEDIARLLALAQEEDFLRQVMGTRHYQAAATSVHPNGLNMVHSMVLYGEQAGLDSSAIDGGKTGQLKESGYCLASFKAIDDLVIIIVTSGAENSSGHIADHLALYQALQNQLPPDGSYEIAGIGQRLPLTPQPSQTGPDGQPLPSPDKEAGSANTLKTIAIAMLALLLTLGLILLISLLVRKNLESQERPPKDP